jgi:hypothetical protein
VKSSRARNPLSPPPAKASPSRILLVRVFKFESDSQIRTEFGYDITFEVYDAKGRLLASNRVQELKIYGPSYPAYGFARKNLPATIRKALAEGVSPLCMADDIGWPQSPWPDYLKNQPPQIHPICQPGEARRADGHMRRLIIRKSPEMPHI